LRSHKAVLIKNKHKEQKRNIDGSLIEPIHAFDSLSMVNHDAVEAPEHNLEGSDVSEFMYHYPKFNGSGKRDDGRGAWNDLAVSGTKLKILRHDVLTVDPKDWGSIYGFEISQFGGPDNQTDKYEGGRFKSKKLVSLKGEPNRSWVEYPNDGYTKGFYTDILTHDGGDLKRHSGEKQPAALWDHDIIVKVGGQSVKKWLDGLHYKKNDANILAQFKEHLRTTALGEHSITIHRRNDAQPMYNGDPVGNRNEVDFTFTKGQRAGQFVHKLEQSKGMHLLKDEVKVIKDHVSLPTTLSWAAMKKANLALQAHKEKKRGQGGTAYVGNSVV